MLNKKANELVCEVAKLIAVGKVIAKSSGNRVEHTKIVLLTEDAKPFGEKLAWLIWQLDGRESAAWATAYESLGFLKQDVERRLAIEVEKREGQS